MTPSNQLEVVIRADSFVDAEQDELARKADDIARFVADRISEDAGIDTIAIELVMQRTDIGPFYKRTALRGECPSCDGSPHPPATAVDH